MPEVTPPPAVLEQAPGCTELIANERWGLALFVREDRYGLDKYPRYCQVDLHLASWDMEPVLLIGLLVRVNRNDLTTFQAWIDAGRAEGVRILQKLAELRDFDLHLVSDERTRSLRKFNNVARQAKKLVEQVTSRPESWSVEQFDEARQQIDTLYPTAGELWTSVARHVPSTAAS